MTRASSATQQEVSDARTFVGSGDRARLIREASGTPATKPGEHVAARVDASWCEARRVPASSPTAHGRQLARGGVASRETPGTAAARAGQSLNGEAPRPGGGVAAPQRAASDPPTPFALRTPPLPGSQGHGGAPGHYPSNPADHRPSVGPSRAVETRTRTPVETSAYRMGRLGGRCPAGVKSDLVV
jgi:hypothetical protein